MKRVSLRRLDVSRLVLGMMGPLRAHRSPHTGLPPDYRRRVAMFTIK